MAVKTEINSEFQGKDYSTSIFHAQNFLSILFCNYKSEGLIEIRCLNSGKKPESIFIKPSDIIYDHKLDEILKLNEEGYNIYAGVNPRPLSMKKKQDDIRDITCLWLDIDGKNFDEGKKEARDRIVNFPLDPTLIVDSGNGYHLYWVLKEPIINSTEESRKEIKQVLSGLSISLGADKQAINFDRVMRLPGTLNLKDLGNPKGCWINLFSPGWFYSLDEFSHYRDYQCVMPGELEDFDLDFGKKESIVDNSDPREAINDVNQLKVSTKIKNMIISGELQKGPRIDETRSGRDQAIITALVASDYNYDTIKSIFFNTKLGCSDRTLEKGDKALQNDVFRAHSYLSRTQKNITPQIKAILDIKGSYKNHEEKTKKVTQFVVKDLLNGEECAGIGYKDTNKKIHHYFDKSQKTLFDIDRKEFQCYLRARFGLLDKDLKDVVEEIRTQIWKEGQEIEVYNFAYFDTKKSILYISNNDNQIYRMDGSKIELVDNGTDGIIFEIKPNYQSINVDVENINAVNYFEDGFSWKKFESANSFLYKYLIQRSNFAKEERHNLSAEEQKHLLVIYIYSIFFESILEDKPILCFEGVKASGKSFTATSIGKILFGKNFQPDILSENRRDFHVTLCENYYVVFDNLDSGIKPQQLNDLCISATGGEISYRKLYSNSDEVKATPHVFIVVTTREPKFKRDDFVDRLLLFNTEKIRRPVNRSSLNQEISDNREQIWGELLINLNGIVKMLKQSSRWKISCVFRIADWEVFGRKVHSKESRGYFVDLLKKMNKEKNKFSLEDDPLYILLWNIVYDHDEDIEEFSASNLYEKINKVAEDCKMEREFVNRYRSPMSLSKRIINIKEELCDEFDLKITKAPHGKINLYSIRQRSIKDEEYAIEERVAIMEHDGGLSKGEAEQAASSQSIFDQDGEVVR